LSVQLFLGIRYNWYHFVNRVESCFKQLSRLPTTYFPTTYSMGTEKGREAKTCGTAQRLM